MKKLYLIACLILCLIFITCSDKDDSTVNPPLTKAEMIAQKLQQYIDESHPETAAAFIYDYQTGGWINDNNGSSCSGYKIEGQFIQICGVYYDLDYLVKYEPGNTLKLYFEY